MGYCDGGCEFFQKNKRHTCAKYGINGTRLTYIKQTGALSFEAHEKCDLCKKDEWINKLEEKIKAANEMLKNNMFGEWHEIKKCLPNKQGYYLVALERIDWVTKEKYYETELIFFRGKRKWAKCSEIIKAWMELPTPFK